MALLNETFVTDEIEDVSFEPLPVGSYIAQIKKSIIKATSSGTGEYIANTWEILEADDPKHVGRIVFQNLNIVNPNETAVKIAKSQVKQINKALNIPELNDTDEWLGQPMKVMLKIRPAKDGYDASNDIAKVQAIGSDSDSEGEGVPWEE